MNKSTAKRLGLHVPDGYKCCGKGEKCVHPLGCIQPATTDYFNRYHATRDGLTSHCKACAKANSAKHYANNREAYNRRVLEYRQLHIDSFRSYQAEWQRQHRAQCNENARRWRTRNKDRQAAATRRWYLNNREVVLNRQKSPEVRKRRTENFHRRRLNDLEQHREKERALSHRRRARKLSAGGVHTHADVVLQGKAQRWHCWWCDKPVNDNYHVDHRIPLSRGGSNAPENLCIACPECNMSKGNKLPHEWNGRLL